MVLSRVWYDLTGNGKFKIAILTSKLLSQACRHDVNDISTAMSMYVLLDSRVVSVWDLMIKLTAL